jgi:hypothetical protein
MPLAAGRAAHSMKGAIAPIAGAAAMPAQP